MEVNIGGCSTLFGSVACSRQAALADVVRWVAAGLGCCERAALSHVRCVGG